MGSYTDAVLAVVDQERSLRRQLTAAWDVAEAWRRVQPSQHRRPMPGSLVLAMVTLATAWGWWGVALLVYLGCVCMLRPAELTALTWTDFSVPHRIISAAP